MSDANKPTERKTKSEAHVIKAEAKPESIASSLSTLSNLGKGDGTAFSPLEAIAAGMRAGNAFVQIGGLILLWIVRGFIAPVEMVLRWKFGERYYNTLVCVSILVVYGVVPTVLEFPVWFSITMLILMLVRLWLNSIHCFIRDRKGDYWHSYSEGASFIRLKFVDRLLANWNFTFDFSVLIVEPLIFVLLGVSLGMFMEIDCSIDNPFNYDYIEFNRFALWTLLLGLISFFYQLYCFFHRRNLMLNELDDKVMAEARTHAKSEPKRPGIAYHRGVAFVKKGGEKKEWRK